MVTAIERIITRNVFIITSTSILYSSSSTYLVVRVYSISSSTVLYSY